MLFSVALILAYHIAASHCLDTLTTPNFWDPNDSRWKVKTCSLALFQGTQSDTNQPYWIGNPLTDIVPTEDTKCAPLEQLTLQSSPAGRSAGSLYQVLNGYRIRGTCGCSFFEDSNCRNHTFDAISRDDDDLPRTGSGNKVAAISCWEDPGSACCVQLYTFRSYNTVEGSPKNGPEDQQEYFPFALDQDGACLPVSDPLKGRVTSLIQRYCARCRYYDNLQCTGTPLLEYMQEGGEVGDQDLEDVAGKIQAYACNKHWGSSAVTGDKGDMSPNQRRRAKT
ncbi:hypothetical protein Dda_7484 [Drechslerella dactyloides]|uniref:Uncharacterized protein n=1 Tax=Drechslerella dactyloides TaxID=74499 RepID=A0AAD6NFL8_DREDA|nr:hypothetical protein Dda_7484 [Drechslerella dactyloides]